MNNDLGIYFLFNEPLFRKKEQVEQVGKNKKNICITSNNELKKSVFTGFISSTYMN